MPTTLARVTKAANEQVEKTELADLKTSQEMAQVIGEIANNGITIVLKPKLDEAERQKAEAEAILKEDKTNAVALEQKRLANEVIKTYGQGSQIQLAVRAVTGVLQGIATGEATQAAVGGLSPYANYAIKEATTDKDGNVNTEANLMAHALLGAVEAYATGNNATAGAAGAIGGELAAKIITEQLYQKIPEQLTEAQKQTVTTLSQLASGLAGGLISDSTAGAINAAEIGKRAVEDNGLLSGQVSDLFRELEAAEKDNQSIEEIFIKAKALSDKQYRELETNCSNSVICRYGTEKVLEDANQKAFELIGYFNSRLTNLSYDSQVKFIEFVIDENSKEFNFIEKNRTVAEKLVVGLVDSFIESQQTQGIKISPKIASFAKKNKITLDERPQNLSPEGARRQGAFNEAKRQSGIPISQQPSRTYPNVDRRGYPQPGRIYEFDLPKEGGGLKRVIIRDDAKGHFFGENNPQNRGPHFNDPQGRHYDY